MANAWFRLYHEFATDPKVQMLSEKDQRRYIMLLCLRCCNGDVTLHDEEVSFQLRISNEEWMSTKSILMDKKLIDEASKPVAWDKRQFASDSSAERVAKHRINRKKNGLPGQDWIKKDVREAVLKNDSVCVYCGKRTDLTIDHKTPVVRGGDNSISNLQPACRSCNGDKGKMTHEEYLSWPGRISMCNNDVTLQKRHQITDTDTDTEYKLPKGNSSPEEPGDNKNTICPHKKIISLYNEKLGNVLPQCKVTNKTVEANLRTRWREDESRQNLEWWSDFFKTVSESDFLMGKINSDRPFMASFDWLVKPMNMTKVLNGNYSNAKGRKGSEWN